MRKYQPLKDRLTSRKFWIAVLSFVAFYVVKQYDNAAQVVIAFIAVVGVQEAVVAFAPQPVASEEMSPEETEPEPDPTD